MDAIAEGEMARQGTRDVQFVWIAELRLVVVCRGDDDDDDIALLDLLPGKLGVLRGKARRHDGGWPAEAQQFLDGVRNQV